MNPSKNRTTMEKERSSRWRNNNLNRVFEQVGTGFGYSTAYSRTVFCFRPPGHARSKADGGGEESPPLPWLRQLDKLIKYASDSRALTNETSGFRNCGSA